MARTTRSSVAQQDKPSSDDSEKQATSSSPPATRKQQVKKRKRLSDVEHDGQPAAKLARAEGDEGEDMALRSDTSPSVVYPPLAGDLYLPQNDANKILDILEMIDKQGLLDRVFPLNSDILNPPSTSSPSTSKISSDSFSLRNLLKEAQSHPLRVLRSAVNQLFPISSHPRSKTSAPAAQQERFCELALYLLDQASIHTIDALELTPELILPGPPSSNDRSSSSKNASAASRPRKYALLQRLPNGDWWTSMSTDIPGTDAKALKDMHTSHAELVSILPSSSSNETIVPTLGEFFTGKIAPGKSKHSGPRYVSCGAFLDYGPYTSFAPSFDSEGGEVGPVKLGEVHWRRHERGKMREQARMLADRMRAHNATVDEDMDVDEGRPAHDVEIESVIQEMPSISRIQQEQDLPPAIPIAIDPALLSEEVVKEVSAMSSIPEGEVKTLKTMLDDLGREGAISELLEKNAKALLRLEALQVERLGGEKGGSSTVSEETEEWKTAHSIMDSLTLLASLRPRSSEDSSKPVIIPSSPVLRALHHAVHAQPMQGWYGTLVENRGAALHDDSTVHIRAMPSQPVQPPATPVKAVAAPPYTTPAPAQQLNYAYSGFSQQYRGPYTYTPAGQTNAHYNGNVGSTPAPSTPYASTAQSQYPYAGWFTNYPPGTPGASVPPPAASTPAASAPATYASYTTPGATRAIANTVAVNGWSKTGGYAPPLPPHLQIRPSGPAPYAPSTPTPLSATTTTPVSTAAGGYVAGYQPAPSAVS